MHLLPCGSFTFPCCRSVQACDAGSVFQGRGARSCWVYVNSCNTLLLMANNTSLKEKSLGFTHMEFNVISILTEFWGHRDSQVGWQHDYLFNPASEASCFLMSHYSWKILVSSSKSNISLFSCIVAQSRPPQAPRWGSGWAQVCPCSMPLEDFPWHELSVHGRCTFAHVHCTARWHLSELLLTGPPLHPCSTWRHHTSFFLPCCKSGFP